MIATGLTTVFVHAVLLMHPVHATVCEMQWNPQTHRLEVALRLDLLDEQWIEKRHAGKQTPADETWRARYLKDHLWFDPDRQQTAPGGWSGRPLHWVGRKEEGAFAWWFFEVGGEDHDPPREVRTRVLFDRHQDYLHRVVVLSSRPGGKPKAFLLTDKKQSHRLEFDGDGN
jgi:hypothetical protein